MHALLLEWYDQHRRTLPWRALPGKVPTPYHVLLSEFMLQQTTVTTVIPYFQAFIEKWPTLWAFAQATQDDVYHAWQGLGYYSRAKNLLRCAQAIVMNFGGEIPKSEAVLQTLPGIGPYTAAAIAAIAFDAPVIPVDGNIIRVFSRFFKDETPLPLLKKKIEYYAEQMRPLNRSGDFAQALMDLGSSVCAPRGGRCDICPLSSICASAFQPEAAILPLREPKKERPTRHGILFWVENEEGAVLVERRSATGLLANLDGFPGTTWIEEPHCPHAAVRAFYGDNVTYDVLEKTARHIFTHFSLELTIVKVQGKTHLKKHERWVLLSQLFACAFPTVMKKAQKIAMETGD